MRYAWDGPSFQNKADAQSGPNARARAPRDRNIPNAIPFSFGRDTLAAVMEVRHGVIIAEPVEKYCFGIISVVKEACVHDE